MRIESGVLHSNIMNFFVYVTKIFFLQLITIFPLDARMPGKCYSARLALGGLQSPLAVEFINSHNMLIAEQMGIVKLFNLRENTLKVYLDLTDRILVTNATRDERGLLGLALDPNFSNSGILYVFYSSPSRNSQADHDSVISSFQAKWPRSEENKEMNLMETEILRFEQPKPHQNGGQLFFGDDGYLYITTGDGGDLKNSRFRKDSLLGKILRINVHAKSRHHNYTIPQDNPFINETNSRAEIYAYGFHNPWRCTVDRKQRRTKVTTAAQIFCGDNGEPDRNEEDLFLIKSGGRYGWLDDSSTPCKTLKNCRSIAHLLPSNYHLPIHTYSHEEGQAVIGGIVYRGHQFPELQGHFIFADYVQGTFHTLQNIQNNWITKNMCVRYPSGCKTDQGSERCPHVIGIVANTEDEILILTKTRMFHGDGSEGKIHQLFASYNPNSAIIYSCPFLIYVSATIINLLNENY